MQLTDAEIREILIREKRKKKQRQRRRRRITLAVIVLLFIILIAAIVHAVGGRSGSPSASSESPAGDTRGIIFIDPGHGGEDPGSDSDGRYEKDDTLKLGLAVKDQLIKLGFTVYMSREDDSTVDRTERGRMANKAKAQLMVSIHRNKADGGEGVEAYIPMSDTDEARLLADNIIRSLVTQGFTERTVRAGTLTSSAEDYEENAASDMPSCLVEVGFINNGEDNARFDNNIDGNALAIATAISDTFRTLYETAADSGSDSADSADSTDNE